MLSKNCWMFLPTPFSLFLVLVCRTKILLQQFCLHTTVRWGLKQKIKQKTFKKLLSVDLFVLLLKFLIKIKKQGLKPTSQNADNLHLVNVLFQIGSVLNNTNQTLFILLNFKTWRLYITFLLRYFCFAIMNKCYIVKQSVTKLAQTIKWRS